MANNAAQFLRLPVLASSGLAVVASGVLYFKQKYDITIRWVITHSHLEANQPHVVN